MGNNTVEIFKNLERALYKQIGQPEDESKAIALPPDSRIILSENTLPTEFLNKYNPLPVPVVVITLPVKLLKALLER